MIEIIIGDITTLDVDAIVNAANSALAGGGGVDGAIHRAAGPQLREALRPLAPCPTGQARITPGFGLAARWIIHTVGPAWDGGDHREAEQLASCYHHSLALAAENQLTSIAFPSISTGAYRFPIDAACQIAVAAVATAPLDRIVFCMFSERDRAAMQRALDGAA